jgi:hypothetical protein
MANVAFGGPSVLGQCVGFSDAVLDAALQHGMHCLMVTVDYTPHEPSVDDVVPPPVRDCCIAQHIRPAAYNTHDGWHFIMNCAKHIAHLLLWRVLPALHAIKV